jgi:hypothetical protein
MYIYRTSRNAGAGCPWSHAMRPLVGIGNYSFGAADDTAVVPSDTIAVADPALQVPDVLTVQPDVVSETIPTPVVTVPTLTEAEIDQKRFGYFGSMPAAVGTQVITVAGGIALSLAGVLIGWKLKNATRVSTREMLMTTAIAAGSAVAAVFAIRTFM